MQNTLSRWNTQSHARKKTAGMMTNTELNGSVHQERATDYLLHAGQHT
jgi:hypothetical protein